MRRIPCLHYCAPRANSNAQAKPPSRGATCPQHRHQSTELIPRPGPIRPHLHDIGRPQLHWPGMRPLCRCHRRVILRSGHRRRHHSGTRPRRRVTPRLRVRPNIPSFTIPLPPPEHQKSQRPQRNHPNRNPHAQSNLATCAQPRIFSHWLSPSIIRRVASWMRGCPGPCCAR